jgi:hypothetical protein
MRDVFHHIRAESMIERVKSNNVLNPLLWICGITELFAVPAALLSQGYVQIFFCALAAIPIVFALLAYFIWMFKDPNRLHSEEYLIQREIIRQGSKENDAISDSSRTSEHAPLQIEETELLAPDSPPELIQNSHESASIDGD